MLETRSIDPRAGRVLHLFAIFGAALMLALVLAFSGAPAAKADVPNFTSGNQITVGANRWISPRTFEVDANTPLIANNSVKYGMNRIRVTIPTNYWSSPNARYPVLYLLHGGAGGSTAQWTTEGGTAEQISHDRNIIVVTAEGGKVGWYTNWQKQTKGAQRWADYYLTALIPFIDRNVRTIATKQARAIAGLSMGGYGAVRLAQDRPDLFGSVASFSGALNLEEFGTQTVICYESTSNGYGCNDSFGSKWSTYNPVKRAARLKNQNMQILLYAGSGIHEADVLERTMGASTDKFAKALVSAGVPHEWWMYDRNVNLGGYHCDGGHNFGCWNGALAVAMPKMISWLTKATNVGAPPPPPPAQPVGTNVVVNGGFEGSMNPWACGGNCGRDAAGNARSGSGNGWVRHNSGWNNLFQTVTVNANRNYRVSAWIRTSANNADGYFGLRTANGQIVGERRYGRHDGYQLVQFDVNSGNNTQLVVYAGLWANGDTWAQVDDVAVVAL